MKAVGTYPEFWAAAKAARKNLDLARASLDRLDTVLREAEASVLSNNDGVTPAPANVDVVNPNLVLRALVAARAAAANERKA